MLEELLRQVGAMTPVLAQLHAKVDALAAQRQRPQVDELAATLLPAIAAAAESRVFTAAELLAHSRLESAVELRRILGEMTVKQVGRTLRKIEGQRVGDLVLYRVRAGREGLDWRISRVRNPQNSWLGAIG